MENRVPRSVAEPFGAKYVGLSGMEKALFIEV
jgi:hypothetical protein